MITDINTNYTGIIDSYNGMYYRLWKATELTSNYLVVVQGSGEFSTRTDGSDLPNFIDKNSYAAICKQNVKLPFKANVLVAASYKSSTQGMASQEPIRAQLSSLLRSLNATKVILTGYSYGGQFGAGMLTNSLNTNQKISDYKDSDIYDGYVLMAGQVPGSADYAVHADKPVLLIHGTADTAITIWASRNMQRDLNRVYARTKSVQLIEIPNGSHSSSWVKGYSLTDPVGLQAIEFISEIFKEEIPVLDIPLDNMVLTQSGIVATFGDKKFIITASPI